MITYDRMQAAYDRMQAAYDRMQAAYGWYAGCIRSASNALHSGIDADNDTL